MPGSRSSAGECWRSIWEAVPASPGRDRERARAGWMSESRFESVRSSCGFVPPCRPTRSQFPPRYSPLQSDQMVLQSETTFNLEFRNGKRAKDRWTVNRLVTLVGRAPECKIRLTADDIAAYHCGLVLTPAGLWVVDLSGHGVVVNGERMRVSPLLHGAELWVGRFLIGLHSKARPRCRPAPSHGQPKPPPRTR